MKFGSRRESLVVVLFWLLAFALFPRPNLAARRRRSLSCARFRYEASRASGRHDGGKSSSVLRSSVVVVAVVVLCTLCLCCRSL